MAELVVKKLQFPGSEDQYLINAHALEGVRLEQINDAIGAVADRVSSLENFDALRYMGTLGAGAPLPSNANKGDVYKVISAGTIAGAKVEVGDMLICNVDYKDLEAEGKNTSDAAYWDIIQSNIDVDAILAHTHTITLTKTEKTLTHDVTPTKETQSATFKNGAATVTGNHGHTASGSVTCKPEGTVGEASVTPAGTVKLTAPTTAGTNDATLKPSGTIAESTEEYVTSVAVTGSHEHDHTGTTGAAGGQNVVGTVTVKTGSGAANYTPAGTVGNSKTAVTDVEVGVNNISAHEASSEDAGAFTPSGKVAVDAFTPSGTVARHKHNVIVTPQTATHSALGALTASYKNSTGGSNYTSSDMDGTLTIGTTASNVTYVTDVSVTSEDEVAPTFTGNNITPTASFTGDAVAAHKHDVKVENHDPITPNVNVTKGDHNHGFTGTGVQLITSHNLTVEDHTHGFTTNTADSGAHTVTAPTSTHAHEFTGNSMYVHADFTGTPDSHKHDFTGNQTTHDVSVTVNNFTGNFSGTATGDVDVAVKQVVTGVAVGEHKISTVDSATSGNGEQ